MTDEVLTERRAGWQGGMLADEGLGGSVVDLK